MRAAISIAGWTWKNEVAAAGVELHCLIHDIIRRSQTVEKSDRSPTCVRLCGDSDRDRTIPNLRSVICERHASSCPFDLCLNRRC